jgi:membrane protein YqaA with SNARE-associated domain
VSNPYAAPEVQTWPAAPAESWPIRRGDETRVETVRREATVALLTATYSVLLGGLVGVIWPRVAPHVQVIRAIDGSEAAAKALLGDDMWFALLGIAAGVLAVGALLVAAREDGRGPGGVLGLAVGGVLGSLVAAHIGHRIQQPHIITTLHTQAPHLTHAQVRAVLGYFTFEVRAKGVFLAWPVAAVLVHAATVILRSAREGSTG